MAEKKKDPGPSVKDAEVYEALRDGRRARWRGRRLRGPDRRGAAQARGRARHRGTLVDDEGRADRRLAPPLTAARLSGGRARRERAARCDRRRRPTSTAPERRRRAVAPPPGAPRRPPRARRRR